MRAALRRLLAPALAVVALLLLPTAHPRSPFDAVHIPQPVRGALRGISPDGWREGKLCNVTLYGALGDNLTDDTQSIQAAIDACGDLPGAGGTVLLPAPGSFRAGSLWLRSNLTFRIERGATLIGSRRWSAYPMTYTRAGCTMMEAHASLLNAGRCLEMKQPSVGWDDCARWSQLENVVLSGGGTIDGDGDQWADQCTPKCPDGSDATQRPTLLGLLWVDGLTIRDLRLVRSGFWTVHPAFSNNVRIVGITVLQTKPGTDGVDPDSCWNVYIANNTISTRDDCVALKAGKDWSGRLVNISTENVLIERNQFLAGHGVAIGSETSGWVRDVVVRDSTLGGAAGPIEALVRIKSMRGRGGGVERVLYESMSGVVQQAIQINLVYKKAKETNATATPIVRDITVRNMELEATGEGKKGSLPIVLCDGLSESAIQNLTVSNVTLTRSSWTTVGKKKSKQECKHCEGHVGGGTTPALCISS
jgi:exo-poly-alpha-galacturonosidase